MLDAFLAGVGGFSGGDVVRDMANESDVLAAADFGDGEIGFAGEIGLDFDEVGAAVGERVDVIGGLGGVGDDQGWLEEWRIAVEVRAGEENSRGLQLAVVNFLAKRFEGVEIAAHVAGRGDAVG